MKNISEETISQEYAEAYVEILEIISRMDINDYRKILPDLIEEFENKTSTTYSFTFDDTKELHEQKLMTKTKEILAMIFIDYLATEEEKNIIKKKQKEFKIRQEKELSKKYSYDNIFKNKENAKTDEEQKKDGQLIKKEKKNFIQKLKESIKNIFFK